MLLADLGDACLLVIKTFGKGKGEKPLFKPLRKPEDYEETANVLRKFDLKSDDLMAHAFLQAAKELLERSAGTVFINKGLFSNYFLKERLAKSMSERGRSLSKEALGLFPKIDECLSSDSLSAVGILQALGFNALAKKGRDTPNMPLTLRVRSWMSAALSLPLTLWTFRTGEMAAPSYQAVARLRDYSWSILSNGPVWRIYCKRSPSESTSFFELNLEGISDASDPRLIYFAAIFSAPSFIQKGGTNDIDLIYEGRRQLCQGPGRGFEEQGIRRPALPQFSEKYPCLRKDQTLQRGGS